MPLFSKDAYEVHLPVFDGPLDLLLQLIEREKLDISSVSLAQVTDQFLTFVQELETVEADTLADFLVMASRLVYIKSRVLLPQEKTEGEEAEEDPGEALARQLREYKRFREAAQRLQEIEESGQRSYVRVAPPPDLERRLDPGELSLAELLKAAQAALVALPPAPPVGTVVAPFKLTIQDQIHLIAESTSGNKHVSFRSLLRRARNRVEIVVTLLAVLELLKRRQIVVEQESLFGEIMIKSIEGVEITWGSGNGHDNGNGTAAAFQDGDLPIVPEV